MNSNNKMLALPAALFAAIMVALLTPSIAYAGVGGFAVGCGGGGLGDILCNIFNSTHGNNAATKADGLLAGLSYLFGLVIGIWAIVKFYEHVQNPQQVSVFEPLKKTLVAGCLFALPKLIEVVYVTMQGGLGTAGTGISGWSGKASGGGLDTMVVALMNDVFNPFSGVIMLFCYLAGVILVMIGITRLMKSAQEGPRGPGGFGTIMTFLIAGALFSADEMMYAFTNSFFGGTAGANIKTTSALQFNAGLKANEEQHVLSVISAVLAFVMILGWISFVRGWFIIRDVAEGNQQASLMAGLTHLFGGALAINLGPVLEATQATFGLSAIGIKFS